MLDLEQLTLAINSAAIALLLVICVLILRDARHLVAMRFGLLVAVSTICMLAAVGSDNQALPGPYFAVYRSIAIGNTLFVWLFALAIFQDDFRFDRQKWLVIIAWYGINFPLTFLLATEGGGPPRIMPPLLTAFALALLGHAGWIAWSGRGEDLVESRRRFRSHFVLSLVAVIATIILIERAGQWIELRIPIVFIRNTATFALSFWALIWLSRMEVMPLLQSRSPAEARQRTEMRARDRLALERLTASMEEDNLWREPGLTIRDLSHRIGLPEHTLRTLINKQLGHRNFSAFLNAFRLQDVKAALADPEKARLPILTIALDAGYGSLAPFNRAFKAEEGITPSEWRERALSER